ncbi:MAG TPA: PHB depolymerase family esterase [Bacillota bacterium]|nr:PHB depolymerase family esterase [Bacillota bacterium]
MPKFLEFNYEGDYSPEGIVGFSYKLYIPSGYKKGTKTPLLVMIHGCDQTPDVFAAGTRMNELAEKENFIVLYPAHPIQVELGNPDGCWLWFYDQNLHRGKGGEPDIIVGMIHEVKKKYSIDSNRIYAAGLSSGAAMTVNLGVTYPDIFCGIGICSGLEYHAADMQELDNPLIAMDKGGLDPYECGNMAFQEMGKYKRKMPVIVFHGTSDTTVHPINAQQLITQWSQTNFLVDGKTGKVEIAPAMVKTDIVNEKSYLQNVYNDPSGSPLIELWLVNGMSHAWSGGSADGTYTDTQGPVASSIIWNFFTKHDLGGFSTK